MSKTKEFTAEDAQAIAKLLRDTGAKNLGELLALYGVRKPDDATH